MADQTTGGTGPTPPAGPAKPDKATGAPGAGAAPKAEGGPPQPAAAPAGKTVPAFPAGEASFPEQPPLTKSADFGHWVLQGTLWGLILVCGMFLLVGCIRTANLISDYYF